MKMGILEIRFAMVNKLHLSYASTISLCPRRLSIKRDKNKLMSQKFLVGLCRIFSGRRPTFYRRSTTLHAIDETVCSGSNEIHGRC